MFGGHREPPLFPTRRSSDLRKASWPSARCAEELCTNCGRKSERKSLGTFPKLHGFRCSSKFSMRRKSYRYRCIHLKIDRKSTRLNSSHLVISYAVFCLKKKE